MQNLTQYKNCMKSNNISWVILDSYIELDGVQYAAAINDGVRIVIPADELEIYRTKRMRETNSVYDRFTIEKVINRMINASVPYIVTSVDEENSTVYASRNKALEKMRSNNPHKVGDEVFCNVVEVNKYCAVVEFDGYIGTIAPKDTSLSRVFSLDDYYTVGRKVNAKIKEFTEDGYALLALNEHGSNPYDEYVVEKNFYPIESTCRAKIREIRENLMFLEVQLGVNVIANMPRAIKNFRPRLDDVVKVKVRGFNNAKRTISGTIIGY